MQGGAENNVFEVFRMDKRGEPYVHVGSVLSADPEIALLTAQECYGRREGCVSIWVVRRADIVATPPEAEETFQINTNKHYRFPRLRPGRVQVKEEDEE